MQFWVIFSCVSTAYPLFEWNWLASPRIRTHKPWYFSMESEKALRFLLEKLVLTSMMHGYLQSSESPLHGSPASKTWKCHSVIGSDAGFWHWKGWSCSLTNCCTPCTFSATLCSYLRQLNLSIVQRVIIFCLWSVNCSVSMLSLNWKNKMLFNNSKTDKN